MIALTFVYDTAAFLSGSVWGGQFFQRPLAPSVSPKKSVEGLVIGGLITVIVSVALVSQFVDPLQDKRIEALLLGIVVAAAATFGDLAESLIKRDVGIKDMSSLLPGHGGVLDRIDSLLFVAPAAFLLFRDRLRLSPRSLAWAEQRGSRRCVRPRGRLDRMKSLTILGSTGSIGTQALDVVRRHPDRFKVVGLSAAGANQELLVGQVREFLPPYVAIADEQAAADVKDKLGGVRGVELLVGPDAAERLAADTESDMVLNALVGSAGLGAHARDLAERQDPGPREQGEPGGGRGARHRPDQGRTRTAAAGRFRARRAGDGDARRAHARTSSGWC